MKLDGLRERKIEYARYMSEEITHVCKNMDKRASGSDGEKQAIDYMATQLSDSCDKISIEPFKVNPASFMGWIYISVTCVLLAYVSSFFSSMLAIVLILVGVVPMIGQFVLYKRMTDPLYPDKLSHNITAVKECEGEVKRRIFFNGHADAACEWTINYRLGGMVLVVQVVTAIVGVLFVLVLALARWIHLGGVGAGISEGAYLYAGLAGLVFVPSWILAYFFSNNKFIVDGANDDLSGCYMGIAIMKALKDSGIKFENTEVGVIITGSQEAGLRGAKAWCEQHADEYSDAETIIVSFDTIREGKFLQVNHRDLNGLVKSDKRICDLFLKAAKECDVEMKSGVVPLGATNSAAFTQGGFRSVGITALNHTVQNYYHTRYDSYDNLSEVCLADCFDVSVNALQMWANGVEPLDDTQIKETEQSVQIEDVQNNQEDKEPQMNDAPSSETPQE